MASSTLNLVCMNRDFFYGFQAIHSVGQTQSMPSFKCAGTFDPARGKRGLAHPRDQFSGRGQWVRRFCGRFLLASPSSLRSLGATASHTRTVFLKYQVIVVCEGVVVFIGSPPKMSNSKKNDSSMGCPEWQRSLSAHLLEAEQSPLRRRGLDTYLRAIPVLQRNTHFRHCIAAAALR
ncbi:hypothetical protein CEXT_234211 [Caerostris extrusa]|uniref:Uncharacterized protein n=1 Tax=Caerostris extrusa TaxID=172846 RepID=A0AAV4QYM1_CAEEX|nr:hypothetical protein CEXT_234211 [Caerostris extrusa]